MSERALLESMSQQMAELVRHVAEVRRTHVELKAGLDGLRGEVGELKTDVAELKTDVAVLKTDVAELKTDVAELKSDVAQLKIDASQSKADVAILRRELMDTRASLSSKIDHFVGFVSAEVMMNRTKIEEESFVRSGENRRISKRLTALEGRVTRLEAREHSEPGD